ncbi:MAG: hypothetical protein LBP52_00655 [Burkholderiaceae bacterium]|jgi:hypothetical protein|nr:hypothetical protein [Burkholderiaceae bacterium]
MKMKQAHFNHWKRQPPSQTPQQLANPRSGLPRACDARNDERGRVAPHCHPALAMTNIFLSSFNILARHGTQRVLVEQLSFLTHWQALLVFMTINRIRLRCNITCRCRSGFFAACC